MQSRHFFVESDSVTAVDDHTSLYSEAGKDYEDCKFKADIKTFRSSLTAFFQQK